MNYEQARTNFEFHVSKMQDDVKQDYQKLNLSEKAKEYRLGRVNALVDFYQLSLEQISELQLQVDEWEYRYKKLHHDAQRLVLFCQLHEINPNMIFHYSLEELKAVDADGVRFVAPEKSFDRMNILSFNDNTLEFNYKELSLEEQAIAERHHSRYLVIKQMLERSRHAQ